MKRDRTPGSHARRGAGRIRKKRPETAGPIPREAKPRRHVLFAVGTTLTALLIILLALSMIGSSDAREYKNHMNAAAESYAAGDYDSALSSLRKAAAIDDTRECRLLMADCYEAQENYEKALEVLRKLDLSDETVAKRIAAVEQRRSRLLAAEKIFIGGKAFPPDATGLVLDGLAISEEELQLICQFRSLDNLSLADNGLEDISALAELRGLATLNLSGNKISDISALGKLTGLRSLYLDSNPLKDLSPLLKLENLTTLSITGINISAEKLEKLSKALPGCAIHSDASAENAVEISIGGVTFKSDVQELDLSGMGIRDVSSLALCQNLVHLNLSGNDISDISPLLKIPGLEWLDISENHLVDMKPLIGIGTLRYVDASGNEISGTSTLGMMTGLTELYLSDNPLTDFSGLKKLRNLQTLGLNNTGVTDAALQYLEYLSSLTELELEGNPDISGEAMDGLKKALGSCLVSHDRLIYSVDVAGVSVREDATELDLTGMGISDISGMGNLSYLETVKLANNSISNIYILRISNSRNTISYLDLSGNALEDITPIASLQKLETLKLSNNSISSIQPLMSMTSLKALDISGNKLSEEQIKTLRETLVNCEITS